MHAYWLLAKGDSWFLCIVAEKLILHEWSDSNEQAFVTVSRPGGLDTYVNSGNFQRLVQWKDSAWSAQKVSGSSRLCLCNFLYCSMVLTWAVLLSEAGGGYKADSVIATAAETSELAVDSDVRIEQLDKAKQRLLHTRNHKRFAIQVSRSVTTCCLVMTQWRFLASTH